MSSADRDRSDPLPTIARTRTLLFALAPAGRRWSAGLRSAAAFAFPALGLVAAGHRDSALFVMFGAFAVLYGEGRAFRVRATVVLGAGVALLTAVALGAFVGTVVLPQDRLTGGIVETCVLTVIAVLAVFVVDAARLGPPGALFFVLVCAGALVARAAGNSTSTILGCAALGVAASVAVSMAGMLIDPRKPERTAVAAASAAVDAFDRAHGPPAARDQAAEALATAWAMVYDAGLPDRAPESPLVTELLAAHRRLFGAQPTESDNYAAAQGIPVARPTIRYRLGRSLNSRSHAMATTLRVGVACAIAGALDAIIGSTHPHWAILAAVIVLQSGPDLVRGRVRAAQRLMGTLAGLALFAGLAQLSPTGYALIAVLAVLQFAIELFIARNYAVAAVFITPVALFAGGASASATDFGPMLRDRLIETLIGVLLAVAVMYTVLPHAHRRTFYWTEHRVRTAARVLLARLSITPVYEVGMDLRRDLQYELAGCVRAGIDSAHNDSEWTASRWDPHAGLIRAGYDLLAACWTVPPGARLPETHRWSAAFDEQYPGPACTS